MSPRGFRVSRDVREENRRFASALVGLAVVYLLGGVLAALAGDLLTAAAGLAGMVVSLLALVKLSENHDVRRVLGLDRLPGVLDEA